jgi:putative DNA primase/helicase
LAARVSRGKRFPHEENPPDRDPANVILLNAEDSTESVIAPRLKAAGADPDKVFVLNSVRRVRDDGTSTEVEFSLTEDIETLDKLIQEIGSVSLVIIDPVSAYLGKVDSHNNSEVRSVLAPLSRLAEKHNVAVVCVSHLNKGGDAKVIYRVTGSLAFGAAARTVIVVGPNPDDDTGKEKVFCPAKSNLAKLQSALTFTVKDVLLPL